RSPRGSLSPQRTQAPQGERGVGAAGATGHWWTCRTILRRVLPVRPLVLRPMDEMPMASKHHPYHPIIYVRGFAATHDEIEETVADPYMGFNLGSTKSRQVWDGRLRKYFFESPLVRLKDELVYEQTPEGKKRSDRRYDDVYVDGEDLTAPDPDDPKRPQ